MRSLDFRRGLVKDSPSAVRPVDPVDLADLEEALQEVRDGMVCALSKPTGEEAAACISCVARSLQPLIAQMEKAGRGDLVKALWSLRGALLSFGDLVYKYGPKVVDSSRADARRATAAVRVAEEVTYSLVIQAEVPC